MRRRPRAVLVVSVACAALGASACGSLPPQAPVGQASVISGALTTIAASCGQSYRLREFTPHPDLSGLEATAAQSARKLEAIRARHPKWVYQGETLTQIAGASVQSLEACSLSRAGQILRVS
jgi:hypothetical protein